MLAVGGSNTEGRWKPYYFTELADWLNDAFPVTIGDGRHTVHHLGRGGHDLQSFTDKVHFGASFGERWPTPSESTVWT